VFCHKCGTNVVDEEARFCPKCGTELKVEPRSSSTSESPIDYQKATTRESIEKDKDTQEVELRSTKLIG
jgi:uncharacterized membrane protein YvbJ